MSDHAEIPGVENIGAPLIFFDGKIFPGSALFRHRVFPSAGMRAGAPVGVSAGKPCRQQASARIGDAHSSVNKRLDLQIRRSPLTNLSDLIERELPGANHTCRPHSVPEAEGLVVCVVSLCGDVDRYIGTVLSGEGEHSRVSHQNRVRSDFLKEFKIGCGLLEVLIVRIYVCGDMYLNATFVGVTDPLPHILRAEIPGLCAQAEGLAADIYRVRSEVDRRAEHFEILRGDQKLGFDAVCIPSFFHRTIKIFSLIFSVFLFHN